jgi:tetratricopeptide (TPR) repeat protein
MNIKAFTFILITLCCNICLAQRRSESNAGKVLSFDDSTQVTELFFSGLGEKAKQNTKQAATYFKQIIEIDPANDAALFELATIYHTDNQEKEAEQMVREAINRKPNNEWYWVLLSNIYKKTNNLAPLNQVFDELIKLSPNKEDYYYDKATGLLGQNKVDDALKVYDILEKKRGLSEDLIEARQRIYQKQGKTGAAAQELEKAVKNNPADSRNSIGLSQLHITAGNQDKALQVLQEAKAADPGNGPVRIALADLYRSQGKTEEAYAELRSAFENPAVDVDSKVRAISAFIPQLGNEKIREEATNLANTLIQVNSNNAKAQAIAGDIFLKNNNLTNARNAYKKAVELNGEDYHIWDNLVAIEISESDFDAAIKDGEEALSLFPSQAALYLYTGLAYTQKKNYTKAISYFKNAISLETEDKDRQARIYSGFGEAYSGLKNIKESDFAYEKALQLAPNNAFALSSYAYTLSERGDNPDKAALMARRSNELKPNDSALEDTYALVLFKQKKYKDARLWIEKAIKDSKTDNAIQFERYGDILSQMGETEPAVQQWTKAKSAGLKSEKLERKINEKKYIE